MRKLPSVLACLLICGPVLTASADDKPAPSLKPIDIEVTVRAPLADVWNAWTTNAGAEKWFAPKTNIELKAGGAYEILFSPDKSAGQRGAEDLKVLCYLPREMLTFDWSAPPQFAKARAQRTWVVVRLKDLGDGSVRVRLTQAGFAERAAEHPDQKEEWEHVRDYFTKAWPFVLDKLQKYFEKTTPVDGSTVAVEGIIAAPLDAVWDAFTTKKGLESWMAAHTEIDLKVGGKMLTHYDAKGKIGDPDTIENIILSFEPKKMLSIKVGKPPEKFPFKEAVKNMWSVIYFEPVDSNRTRLRVVGLGYGSDEESKKLRAFFEKGNAYTVKQMQEHFAGKTGKTKE